MRITHFTHFTNFQDTKYLHYLLDKHLESPVNWTAKQLLMKDKHNYTSFLVERSDRGHYWLYLLYEGTFEIITYDGVLQCNVVNQIYLYEIKYTK